MLQKLFLFSNFIFLVQAFSLSGQALISNETRALISENNNGISMDVMRANVVKAVNASVANSLIAVDRQGSGGGSGTGGTLGPFIPAGAVATILILFKGVVVTLLSTLNTITIPAIITTLFFIVVGAGAVFIICLAADCQENLGNLVGGSRPPKGGGDGDQTLNRNEMNYFEQFRPIYEGIQHGYHIHGPPLRKRGVLKLVNTNPSDSIP